MKKVTNSQIKNITKAISSKKCFYPLVVFSGLILMLTFGLEIYAVKIVPYIKTQDSKTDEQIAMELQEQENKAQEEKMKQQVEDDEKYAKKLLEEQITHEPLVRPIVQKFMQEPIEIPESYNIIENENIKNLINEQRKEVSPNFNLKIINPCPGSIEVLVNGHEKDREPIIFYPDLEYFTKKVHFGDIEYSINLIREFSIECINNFSNTGKEIVFTGFGANEANKEFSIIFSILSGKKNIIIRDIHLVDPVYKGLINELLDIKKIDHDHLFYKSNTAFFKEITSYVYLLNKKLQTNKNTAIRLFFHDSTKSYLKCIRECKLNKTNCLATFNIPVVKNAEENLINFISNGTQDQCLFVRNGYIKEEGARMQPKVLDKESKTTYIKSRPKTLEEFEQYVKKKFRKCTEKKYLSKIIIFTRK
jgi:hypothetical protein